jgi:ABC-type multidrug transport system ATPase subunit
MSAIVVENISKSFGKVKALKSVSFEVKRNELFGLIGPDGAGKTTLFRLLTTLLNPDEGQASVDGYDIVKDYKKIRQRVGYMPGKFSLYQDLTIEENLSFFAALFGVKVEDSYELIAPIYRQIEPFKKRKAGKLSGGMKQKLALSCALIHSPSILFLDEPTTGVDAVSRSEFWDMLSMLKEKGITILVSTPYMDEASRCDRIALCNEGALLSIDTPTNITEGFDAPLYAVKANNLYQLLQQSRLCDGVVKCYPFGESHHLVVDETFNVDHYKSQLKNIEGLDIQPVKPSIEDMFIKLMEQ